MTIGGNGTQCVPSASDQPVRYTLPKPLGRGIDASVTWSDVLATGVEGDVPLPLDAQVLVIDLPYLNAGEVERLYRVGTVNFSALLRYNRSYFYASAVVELASAIARMSDRPTVQ